MATTPQAVTPAAEALTAEYNRCARTGTLSGGKLAYTKDGPGEWFAAGELIERAPGAFSIAVRPDGRLTRREAQRCIDLAAQGRPWEPEEGEYGD